MKKRFICFVLAMLMMVSVSGTVFAADLGSPDAYDLGPDHSLQLMYAKMQLEMSEIAKQQAMDKLNQIAEIQEEQRQVANFLNAARQSNEEAAVTNSETEMPADMAEYMITNGLSYDTTGGDLLMTSEEWDTAIMALESRLDELGMETQQMMLNVQNYMGQYNLYLQGANTYPTNGTQTITSLARGQSMYGDSEVGLAVTGLVVGLVLGCAITLAVQKLRRKKENV